MKFTLPVPKPFVGTVVDVEKISHDVIVPTFKVPNDFSFEAGQFVVVRFNNGTETKPRSYSILNPPFKKGILQSCIKLIDGGFASEVLKKIKNGDEFPMMGPLGGFRFDKESGHPSHWFICTGAGITPLYSMIYQYLGEFPNKQFTLLFGTKTKRDLIFYKEFQQLEKENPNFKFLVTLTREEWDGLHGRVQEHIPRDVSNTTFYICGLKEMVLGTKDALERKGVDPKHIRFERFT